MRGLGWPVEGFVYKGWAGGWAVLLEMPEMATTTGGLPPGFVPVETSLYLLVISNTSKEMAPTLPAPRTCSCSCPIPSASGLGEQRVSGASQLHMAITRPSDFSDHHQQHQETPQL